MNETEMSGRMNGALNETVRGVLGGRISRAFDCMEIAEEELKRAGGDPHPKIFLHLCPGDLFYHCPLEVYRAHVRELIQREVERVQPRKRGDTRPVPLDFGMATDAEVLLAMVNVSTQVVLDRRGVALYHYLFAKVVGTKKYRELCGDNYAAPTENYEGETEEALREARLRFTTTRPMVLIDDALEVDHG